MTRDILIVDDEPLIRKTVAGILEDGGYAPRDASDGTTAIEAIDSGPPPALIILDVWLEGSQLDGMDVLEAVTHRHPEVPVIMISGHGTIDTAVAAIKKGAYEFIEKPLDSDRLLLSVTRALEAAELKREVAELKLRAGETRELIGTSSAIKQIRVAAERAAPTDRRVFITGPAGAGKEIVARLIHSQSRRSRGPFVVANAAMMRPDHVELELFGSEGDGPGGTRARKIGTFERAHGGTLYFDEIADMPLETQGKIARALQANTFEREGGTQQIEVDIRVMAATTRDMGTEIEQGRFREDLYYRLQVTPIVVPALRERREDVPELARFFIQRAAESAGLSPREIGTGRDDDAAVIRLARQCAPAPQFRGMAPYHVAGIRQRPNWRRHDSVGARVGGRAAANAPRPGRSYDHAAPRCAPAIRTGLSQCPGCAIRRQHLAHCPVRRHGALGASPQTALARDA